jgi:hypothetical protein
VDPVADHLEDRLPLTGRAQGSGDGTGRAVVQGRHAVEHVRHQRPAGADPELGDAVERGPGGRGVGVGMPHSRYDARGDQLFGELAGAGALRGEGHLDEVTAGGVDEGLDECRVGVDEGVAILGAAPGHREERSFEVDPGERPLLDEHGRGRHPREERGARCRHQRADEAGRPVAQVVARGGPPRVRIRTELAAGATVTVQVDQAGQQGQAIGPVAGYVQPPLGPPGQ